MWYLYILVVISVFFMFISYIKEKNIFNPLFVFNFWWGLVYLFGALNFYNMYELEIRIVLILGVGQMTFNIIGFFGLFTNSRSLDKTKSNKINGILNINKLFWIQICLLLCLVLLIFKLRNFLFSADAALIRDAFTTGLLPNGSEFMSTIERLFYIHFGVFPAVMACTSVSITFFMTGKIKFKYLIISIINVVLIAFLTGGRIVVFHMTIVLIMSYLLLNKKWINRKRALRICIILIICFAIWNTLQRGVNNKGIIETFVRTLIIYFTGGIHALNSTLVHPEYYGLNQYSVCVVSFNGVFSILYYISYFFTLGKFPIGVTTSYAQSVLYNNLSIANDIYFNAMPTMYYYFMRDFGYLGIVLYSALFASIGAYVYKRVKKNRNEWNVIMYSEVIYLIVFSVCWWDPYRTEFWMILLYYLLIYQFLYKKKKRMRIQTQSKGAKGLL